MIKNKITRRLFCLADPDEKPGIYFKATLATVCNFFACISDLRSDADCNKKNCFLQMFDDKSCRRRVLSLKVKCKEHKSVCNWTGELGDIEVGYDQPHDHNHCELRPASTEFGL